LLVTVLFISGCAHSKTEVPPYVPPEYANAIEICSYNLFDSYFNPVVPEGLADETFKGKNVILKYVTITEDMLSSIQNNHVSVGGWLIAECHNIAVLNQHKPGDIIQIVGQCNGFSEDLVAVVMKDCRVYPENYIASLRQEAEFSSDFY
jgi:hypothetical protein